MVRPNEAERAELSAVAPARQRAYCFLSAAFAEPPTAEQLQALRSAPFFEEASKLFGEPALQPLRDWAEAQGQTAEVHGEARQEFMNLFKVPGGQYVTPYESVFRDTREVAGRKVKGLLMGQSAVDVQKWYRLAAVEISDRYRDLPDHICLELNYMAHLCAKEQQFASAGEEAKLTRAWEMQRDFLAGHIVSWMPLLRDKIHEKSRHAYFRAIADIAVEFTRRDLATLEGLLGKSGGKSAPEYPEVGTRGDYFRRTKRRR